MSKDKTSVDKGIISLTELDIKLIQLEALAYTPRKRGEPATFNLTELRAFIRQIVLDDRQALYELLDKELLKMPECNCKHARYIINEKRQTLKQLFNIEEK